ncbi:hypothetical protein BUALT_Bualt05G0043200 [Buddleja alternifolia]|uniref:Glutaredoxin domain-containing protein n=1 Tax=Buddleja alternifolia TaxID=168488 RepID=A0AAV6XPH1_9LAMI|nr:hypothetical protein BUALT_Bualt05G0043200 [Buddleja alternifolia]
MGCTSSKRIQATVDVYRPPPSSFAVFDVNSIDEPWVKGGGGGGDAEDDDSDDEKPPPPHVPALEKLKAMDDGSRTWDEVSKALEDLKPKLNSAAAPDQNPKKGSATPPAQDSAKPRMPRKSFSFHTLEELEAKTSKPTELKRADSARTAAGSNRVNSPKPDPKSGLGAHLDVPKSLKENIFIVKDRLERERGGKPDSFVKRDPLSDFPEICPPGGGDKVVVYTTSLGGVRRTYEDCQRVKQLMETHRVVYDERDVALDGGFRGELRGLVGEGVGVPRVFVKGRYVGGVDEVVGLNECVGILFSSCFCVFGVVKMDLEYIYVVLWEKGISPAPDLADSKRGSEFYFNAIDRSICEMNLDTAKPKAYYNFRARK